ncbi:ABC transporter ATP-binding protein [Halobacteriaceae archaeon SHR40]|uniref:ABC transporter ATP-binding protein n=1 Tax=Halovenus amylolytica TaxID=2500550 RepID=UPI000FE2B5FC
MTERIELDDVTREYSSVVAVDGISLSIGDGQFHCLLGPNGSGKSTLFRLILGLTRPSSGTVSLPSAVIGCGFQRPNFYPGLTVRENINVFAGVVGAEDWEWNNRVVKELRLVRALDRKAGELSGGFARKLDLTLALIKKPDFLLLDEPLGALDDVSTARFLEFVDEYVDRGNTVFVSTHRVTAFEPYVDRVTVVHEGEVVFDRATGEIDLDSEQSLQEYYVEQVLDREGVSPANRPPIE